MNRLHEGRPLHHLPSAKDLKFDSENHDQSHLFVVEHERFQRMTVREVQDVFRHRDILVVDVPGREGSFDLETFGKVSGVIDDPIQLQGSSTAPSILIYSLILSPLPFQVAGITDTLHVTTTYRDLVEVAGDPESRFIASTLDSMPEPLRDIPKLRRAALLLADYNLTSLQSPCIPPHCYQQYKVATAPAKHYRNALDGSGHNPCIERHSYQLSRDGHCCRFLR